MPCQHSTTHMVTHVLKALHGLMNPCITSHALRTPHEVTLIQTPPVHTHIMSRHAVTGGTATLKLSGDRSRGTDNSTCRLVAKARPGRHPAEKARHAVQHRHQGHRAYKTSYTRQLGALQHDAPAAGLQRLQRSAACCQCRACWRPGLRTADAPVRSGM